MWIKPKNHFQMKIPKELIEAHKANPQGSIEDAYGELCNLQNETDLDGNPLPWTKILLKYIDYIKFCDAQNIEPKYRKQLKNWLHEKQFYNSYSIKGTKRSRIVSRWIKGILKFFQWV